MHNLKDQMECPEGPKNKHESLMTPKRTIFKDINNLVNNSDFSTFSKLEGATSTPIHPDVGKTQNLKCTMKPVEISEEKIESEKCEVLDNNTLMTTNDTNVVSTWSQPDEIMDGSVSQSEVKIESDEYEVLDNNTRMTTNDQSDEIMDGSVSQSDEIVDGSGRSSMLKTSKKKSLVQNQLPLSPVSFLQPDEIINITETYSKVNFLVEDDQSEIENIRNEMKVLHVKRDCVNNTLWESAVNLTIHCQTKDNENIIQEQKIEISSNTTDNIGMGSGRAQNIVTSSNTENVSSTDETVDEPAQNVDLIDCLEEASQLNNISGNSLNGSRGLWSSVSDLLKNVVHGFSNDSRVSNVTKTTTIIRKRHFSDNGIPSNFEKYKRMKLSEIKCRPTIRSSASAYKPIIQRPKKLDKATQTDWLTDVGV